MLKFKQTLFTLTFMSFRFFLSLLVTTLWLTQPFMGLATLSGPNQKQMVCSTCGMHDTCDEVCCCVGESMACGHHEPGLYAAGCTPDHDRTLFFAQEQIPTLGVSIPPLFRLDLAQTLIVKALFSPAPPPQSILSPPELDPLS